MMTLLEKLKNDIESSLKLKGDLLKSLESDEVLDQLTAVFFNMLDAQTIILLLEYTMLQDDQIRQLQELIKNL